MPGKKLSVCLLVCFIFLFAGQAAMADRLYTLTADFWDEGKAELVAVDPANDQLQLGRIEKRIQENHRVAFTYDDEVVELVNSRCTEVESGARMVDAILSHTLLPEISSEILSRMMEGKALTRIHLGVKDANFAYTFA